MNDFYLFANCNFVPDKYNDWQFAYHPLATHVLASEPHTKTYYFGIPLDYAHAPSTTTSMFAFEVYSTRSDLYATHLNSPAMQTFLGLIPAASTTGLDLNHYRAVGGFLDASHVREEAGVMQDVKITCVSAAGRERLLVGLERLVDGVEGGEGGTLTYMGFASLDDEFGARIFGRWRTREDLERFIRRDDVNGFWMGNKEYIRGMDQRLYVPNGRGWLHRRSGYAGEERKNGQSKI